MSEKLSLTVLETCGLFLIGISMISSFFLFMYVVVEKLKK